MSKEQKEQVIERIVEALEAEFGDEAEIIFIADPPAIGLDITGGGTWFIRLERAEEAL